MNNEVMEDFASQINAAHSETVRYAHSALYYAMEVGRLLSEAKKTVEHGKWLPWMRENISFSERSAQAYMRLHINRRTIEKTQRAADFSVRDALTYINKPLGKQELADDWADRLEQAMRATQHGPLGESNENVRLCAERIHRLDRLLAEAFGISPDQYNADGFDLDNFLFGDEVFV